MPLEDLIPLGFEVVRSRPNVPEDFVAGFGRSWTLSYDENGNLLPLADEEAIVVEAQNHKTLHDKMAQAMTTFADNYANWATMTAQQKDAANRNAQRALANLIRQVHGDMSSGGV